MLTQADLQILRVLIRHCRNVPFAGRPQYSVLVDLGAKLDEMMLDATRPTGPYRNTALAVPPTEQSVVETRKLIQGLVELQEMSAEAARDLPVSGDEQQVAAVRLHTSLTKRYEEMRHRLAQLSDVDTIFEENKRLRAELQHRGAPESEAVIEMWKKKALGTEVELNVERAKTKQLSTALQQERIQRQAYEATQQPVIDAASGDFVDAPVHPLNLLREGADDE